MPLVFNLVCNTGYIGVLGWVGLVCARCYIGYVHCFALITNIVKLNSTNLTIRASLFTIFAQGTAIHTIFAQGTPLHTIFAQGQIHRSTNPNDNKTVTQLSAGARENRPIGR